ncbi:AI-2E family transporter [Desulfovibrio sp. OttesenSCG-928-A18]|nr:AI-2E family transporter [Desulfovibrio sp. OttesenSCG-928-A18]
MNKDGRVVNDGKEETDPDSQCSVVEKSTTATLQDPARDAGAAPGDDGLPAVPGESSMPGDGVAGFDRHKLFPWFFLVMLLFSLYLLYYLMQPFLHSIILACVFTAISFPFYRHCLTLTGNRRVPAALIVLLLITLLVALLIFIFVSGLIPQAKTTIPEVNQWLAGSHLVETLNTHLRPLITSLQTHFPELELSVDDIRADIIAMGRSAGQYLLGSATSLVGNTLLFFAHLLLILLIMFFLFIDGESHIRRLSYLFPMKPEQTAVVIESLRRMARAVLVGGFCVAVLQGIAGGIGFALVGIPPLFWGSIMVFAALVPVVGTGLVWVPAVIYLLIMNDWKSALFLAIWCGVGVTSIDSILRPLLMRDGAKVPILFIFMSILGGVNVFGMLGLLYGPLILGLVAVMVNIYAEEYKEVLQNRDRPKEKAD